MSASIIACLSAAYAWSRKLTFVLIGCRTRGTLVTPLPSSGFALRFSDGSVATLPGSLCRTLTTSFLHPGGGASGVGCASRGLRGLDSWVPVVSRILYTKNHRLDTSRSCSGDCAAVMRSRDESKCHFLRREPLPTHAMSLLSGCRNR